MSFYDKLLKLLHKIYRADKFIKDFISGVDFCLSKINKVITRLNSLLHFNRLDEEGCAFWEDKLKITNTNKSIPDRQAKIRAKWLASTHNCIELLQNVCDSWKNGETSIDFIDGRLKLQFIGEFGVPQALESLIQSIKEVQPAHLPLEILFRYLLIENIHEVKTIEQMQALEINMFAFGSKEA